MRKMFIVPVVFLVLVLSNISIQQPSFNGTAPGCSGSGCHSLKEGLASASIHDSVLVDVTISGVSAGKKVAAELVDSSGTVVDYNNGTSENPLTLTATHAGVYRINAGYKSPSLKWDSTTVTISGGLSAFPDSGWQSELIVTEIMFDVPKDMAGDANGDGHRGFRADEFIELYNSSTNAMDISGYQLLDREKIVVYTVPDSTQLNPGQFAVIFGAIGSAGYGANIPDETLVLTVHPNNDDDVGFANGQGKTNFSNSGDCMLLVNPATADTLCEIYWGSAAPVTSKPIYLAYPNTLSGTKISGSIRQSVTRKINDLHWEQHSIIDTDGGHLYSPGFDVTVLTGIAETDPVPCQMALFQNFPNPFNPATKIQYQVFSKTYVDLSVYNSCGQKVRALVSKVQTPGRYVVEFIAKDLSSGIYFYQIKTVNWTETKKMILLQ